MCVCGAFIIARSLWVSHYLLVYSSKLERICAHAFWRTSIEALSIPDSVIELGEGALVNARVSAVVALVHHLNLNASVLVHSGGRVLSRCIFGQGC